MSSYASDTQIVERIVIPMLAQTVILAGATEPDAPGPREAVEQFKAAMLEGVAGLPRKKEFSLMRRAIRLHDEILAPFREAEAKVEKFGLVVFNLLNWAINCGYLVLHDGTAMAKGLDLLLPALEPAANTPKLDDSARKAAAKLLARLQGDGYFQGVTI